MALGVSHDKDGFRGTGLKLGWIGENKRSLTGLEGW